MRNKKKSKLTNVSSKQINDHFHQISFREIKILWKILRELSLTKAEFVQAKFFQDALHYSDVAEFLIQLGILRSANGQIGRNGNLGETDEDYKVALIHRLFQRKTSYTPHLDEFLAHYKEIDGHFEILMDSERRQRFSGIRNLLFDLEFLETNSNERRFWVCSQYTALFLEAKSSSFTTPLQLQAILRARDKLGQEAELAVLKYEFARLRNRLNLTKRIRHMAAENVGAGYDILSFTETSNADAIERFIEVKAVSSVDFKFYWSRNEIETARFHGSNYFLYLVPVSKQGFDMQKLRVIQNPFTAVYLNSRSWLRQEEVASFIESNAISSLVS